MNKREATRLAVLENEVGHIKESQKETLTGINELTKIIKHHQKDLDKLNGRWGLLFMLSSAMFTLGVYFKGIIIEFIQRW